jgi:HD-GYP domain-containing protein (c-di-GMP phosphodiesterase class II)
MFVTVAIPVLILGIYAYTSQTNVYSQEVETSARDSLMTIQAVIDEFDTTNRSMIKVFADNTEFNKLARDEINIEEIQKEIRRFETQFSQIQRIYLILSDGRVVDGAGEHKTDSYDSRVSTAYQKAVVIPGKVVLTTLNLKTLSSEYHHFSYSVAISNPVSHDVEAVVVMDINTDTFELMLSGIHLRIDGTIVVSDGEGNLVFGQFSALRYALENAPQDLKRLIQQNTVGVQSIYGEDYNIYRGRSLKTGWHILGIIPESGLKDLQRNTLFTVIVVMVLMFVAVIWLSSRLQNLITKPIDQLVESISKFELTQQIDSIVLTGIAPNELIIIQDTLNQMIGRIRGQGDELIQVLSNAIEANDEYTKGHCERVTSFALKIGQKIGMTAAELNDLSLAAMLHDIGKLGVPSHILNKPDKLTESEYDIMKSHPRIGARIVSGISSLVKATEIIHQHHERYDGKGYPAGLKEENILLMARVLCISDSYDAMTTRRSYRMIPLSKEAVKTELLNGKGTQFDPKLVDVFLELIEADEIEGTVKS